jgi:hypothetical protein
MGVAEPRVRRRGSFFDYTGAGDPEVGEHESAEGITYRVRPVRPLLKRHVTGGASRGLSRSPRRGARIHTRRMTPGAHRAPHPAEAMIRSESGIGSRPPERTPH